MKNPLIIARPRSVGSSMSPFSGWSTPLLSALPLATRIQRDMDRVFSDFFGPEFGLTTSAPSMMSEREAAWLSPACDIEDLDNEYQISIDVPGMAKEDLHLEIKNHQILVSGERKLDQEKKEAEYETRERFYGKFERVFDLPAAIDEDAIEANYENGVLMISVPKVVESKASGKQLKIGEAARPAKSSAKSA